MYALAAAGQAGVERALEDLRAEIERDMKLMGCWSVEQLGREKQLEVQMSDGEATRMTDPAPQWSNSKVVAGLKRRELELS